MGVVMLVPPEVSMMDFASQPETSFQPRVAVLAAVVVAGGALLGGYAIYEHHSAQNLATQNQQVTAQLNSTQHEVSDLTAKMNALDARIQQQQAAEQEAARARALRVATASRHAVPRRRREDPRFKQMQSQIDAQGKAIAQTQSDLSDTRTALTGSIAHTHGELVALEKKGERNYIEFDLTKSKHFQREGPVEIRLRKANGRHQFADLQLLVDDRDLTQKHVNLYQPVMFSTPNSPQPVQIVINEISKNHIHGYVSAPKYSQSELASATNAAGSAPSGAAQATAAGTTSGQPPARQKLPVPQP